MSVGSGSTSDWVRFFVEAGIPRSASAQYAVTFADNRIGMDMLMDLNKEYLRDMGITVLGDIIAILKHAKAVQGKITTAKVYRATNVDEGNRISTGLAKNQPRINAGLAIPALPKPVPTAPETPKPKVAPPKLAAVRTATLLQRSAQPSSSSSAQVSSRLGPPMQRTFAEMGLTSASLSATAKEVESRSVFKRLGEVSAGDEGEERHVSMTTSVDLKREVFYKPNLANRRDAEPRSAFDRLDNGKPTSTSSLQQSQSSSSTPGIRRSIIKAPASPPTSATIQSGSIKPAATTSILTLNRTSSGKSPGKRVLFQDSKAIDDDVAPRKSVSLGFFANEKSVQQKKRNLILVKTLRDGTKVSQKIDADDPILKKIKVTKRPVAVTRPAIASRVGINVVKNTQVLNSSLRDQEDMLTREPRKRQRITGPEDSESSSSARADRLSPKPRIAPKRISAPMEGYEDFPARKKPLRIAERLGPRQSF